MIKRDLPIIEAKLRKPLIGDRILVKNELLRKCLGDEIKVISLSAPAGYGKTEFICQLENLVNDPFIWYTLDESDNDPYTFLKYMFNGISEYLPGGSRDFALVQGESNSNSELASQFVALLNEKINRIPQNQLYIVLDNFHCITSSEILELINYHIKYLPTKLKIIVTSRAIPRINITRLALNGGYLKIGKEDLALSYSEFQEYFKLYVSEEVCKTPLATTLERIYEICEGWPLALNVAVQLYLKSSKSAENWLKLVISGGQLAAFLSYEVLDKLSTELREFITVTSVLEKLTPEACEYLTGLKNTEEILKSLENQNTFYSRIDNNTYVCHRLLRELLLQKLDQRYDEYCTKAARYFYHNEKYDQAIEYFITINDAEGTLAALKKAGIKALTQGQVKTVERWLKSYNNLYSIRNEWVDLIEGATYLYKGLSKEAERMIKSSFDKFAAKNDREGLNLAMLFESKIYAYKGDFEGSILLAEYAINGQKYSDDYTYYNTIIQKAFCLAIKGEFNEAILFLETGSEMLSRRGGRQLSLFLQRYMSFPYYLKGDNDKAFYYFNLCDEKYDEWAWNEKPFVALFISRAYRDVGELKKSMELFEKTINRQKMLGYSENLYVTYYHYSMLFSDMGDFDTSLHYICLSEELALSGGLNNWYLDVTSGHKSFLLCRCGRPQEGIAIARRILDRIDKNKHFLFAGGLFYTSFTFLQFNEIENAERCLIQAFLLSKSADFRIIQCYSAGLLSYINTQYGKKDIAESYAEICIQLAAAGNFQQGFISIPSMLNCVKIGIAKGLCPEFMARILEKLNNENQFHSFIESLEKMFFTKKSIERDNILKTLGIFSKTGNVTGIPKIFICTFGNMKIYITGTGIDEVGWRTNKAKELFAYLLNKKGEASSSEKLITELWPDSSPDKAKNLLYSSIVHIKHKLSSFGLDDNLKKEQSGYYLKEDGIMCDKWLIDNELEKMKNSSGSKLPEWAISLLENNFMSDIYSDWVTDEQNKLENALDSMI